MLRLQVGKFIYCLISDLVMLLLCYYQYQCFICFMYFSNILVEFIQSVPRDRLIKLKITCMNDIIHSQLFMYAGKTRHCTYHIVHITLYLIVSLIALVMFILKSLYISIFRLPCSVVALYDGSDTESVREYK